MFFGLPGPFQIVSISRPTLAAARRLTRAKLEVAKLLGVECRPHPGVILLAPEEMPDDDCELASNGNGGDVGAAACDTLIEGPQWSGSAHSLPCRFDQHRPGMGAALLANPPVARSALTRLMNARVQTQDKIPVDPGSGKRSTGPIAAINPTATTMSIPGIVISRLISGLASASLRAHAR